MIVTEFDPEVLRRRPQNGRPAAPPVPPKAKTPEELETERAEKYSAAVTALRAADAAAMRKNELLPQKEKLLAAKDSAAEKCEGICAPLRNELREVEAALADYPIQPPTLAKRRDELKSRIAAATDTLYDDVQSLDEKIRPIHAELLELSDTIAKRFKAREELLRNLPGELFVRYFVARQALMWAIRRAEAAAQDHAARMTLATAAELQAANEAQETAHETQAAIIREAMSAVDEPLPGS